MINHPIAFDFSPSVEGTKIGTLGIICHWKNYLTLLLHFGSHKLLWPHSTAVTDDKRYFTVLATSSCMANCLLRLSCWWFYVSRLFLVVCHIHCAMSHRTDTIDRSSKAHFSCRSALSNSWDQSETGYNILSCLRWKSGVLHVLLLIDRKTFPVKDKKQTRNQSVTCHKRRQMEFRRSLPLWSLSRQLDFDIKLTVSITFCFIQLLRDWNSLHHVRVWATSGIISFMCKSVDSLTIFSVKCGKLSEWSACAPDKQTEYEWEQARLETAISSI